MMNSHIASFLVGIANGRSAVSPAPWAPTVIWAWLTASLRSQILSCSPASQLHPKQQQQVHPEHVHEVPVVRRRIQRATAQGGQRFTEPPDYQHQTTESAQNVQHVRRRQ